MPTKIKLTIELVPKSCWYINLHNGLPKNVWANISKKCYEKANYKCEICGGRGYSHPVEAHEVWEYDDYNLIQRLVGLIALCPDCHQVKHIGLAQKNGRFEEAKNHLCAVNKWWPNEADDYIADCFSLWAIRSNKDWEIDISFIDIYLL